MKFPTQLIEYAMLTLALSIAVQVFAPAIANISLQPIARVCALMK